MALGPPPFRGVAHASHAKAMDRKDDPAVRDRKATGARESSVDEHRALRLWVSLARAYATFARALSSKVLEFGLTAPQFGVLEALYHLGPLPLGELADKLTVTGGNVTYVMDRLESHGLVRRERSDEDRRVIMAKLTPKGADLVAEVFPHHADLIVDMVSVLDVEEQEQMRYLLKKLGKRQAG